MGNEKVLSEANAQLIQGKVDWNIRNVVCSCKKLRN